MIVSMPKGSFRWGEIGQWAGLAASVAGLIVEAITGADYGYIILTAGSLAWGVFTKIKYYRIIKGARNGCRDRLR